METIKVANFATQIKHKEKKTARINFAKFFFISVEIALVLVRF
jgi:hypothetical protein